MANKTFWKSLLFLWSNKKPKPKTKNNSPPRITKFLILLRSLLLKPETQTVRPRNGGHTYFWKTSSDALICLGIKIILHALNLLFSSLALTTHILRDLAESSLKMISMGFLEINPHYRGYQPQHKDNEIWDKFMVLCMMFKNEDYI